MDDKLAEVNKVLAVLVSILISGIATLAGVSAVLLLVSIFYKIGLPTAFALQLTAGLGGAIFKLWRVS
ncbi:hypothetical protein H4S14_004167 [Agrobacterium vitis]|nr:hypothetical protein [Agrobacterium vitis]MBE1440393.1 hypothetical protein [Agrobacterium vitis]